MKQYAKAMQEAAIVIQEQEDILQGAVKLYGALPSGEAPKYHDMAHAALDRLLDAYRAKHFNMAAMIRSGGEE